VDITATLVTAALRAGSLPLKVDVQRDVRVRVRKSRAPRLTVLVLDCSGSMGVMRRMSVAKGIVRSLTEESYRRRDYVALVAFRGADAWVAVPPTRRYEDVLEALDKLPTGGRTPLPSALQQLLALARAFRMKHRDAVVRGILVTDGKGNVPLHSSVEEDVRRLAAALAESGVRLEVHDARPPLAFDPAPSYVELIAELTGAPVYRY